MMARRSNFLLLRQYGGFLMVLAIQFTAPQTARAADLPEGYLEARSSVVEALSSGDLASLEGYISEDGYVRFGLRKSRQELTLSNWFASFRAMIEGGTQVKVEDLQTRSGGKGDMAWTASTQSLSWTPKGASSPTQTATWFTTEIWERQDGEWKLMEVHHSSGPVDEDSSHE